MRKNSLSDWKKKDWYGCGRQYRLPAILLDRRTLALVVDIMMMGTEQGRSDKENDPDSLLKWSTLGVVVHDYSIVPESEIQLWE